METGVLERIRGFEADVERSIESIVQQDLLSIDVTNERHRILLDHFRLQQVAAVKALADKLLDAYLDEDEIIEAQNAPSEGPDVLSAAVKRFEGRVADIREYHHTYKDLPPVRNLLPTPDPAVLETLFSVSERYGACLDLEAHYNRYSEFAISTSANVPAAAELAPRLTLTDSAMSSSSGGGDVSTGGADDAEGDVSGVPERMRRWAATWPARPEYVRFIATLPEMLVGGVDATRKLTGFAAYRAFVDGLVSYLRDFHTRTRPLATAEVGRLEADTAAAVEAFWAALVAAQRADGGLQVIGESYSAEEMRGGGGGGDDEEPEDGAATRAVRLPHGMRASCGLAVPPALKKYVKTFSMYPLSLVHTLVAYRSALERWLSAHAGDGDGATAAMAAADEDTAKQRAAMARLVAQLPPSLGAVEELCALEAQAGALLRSLLFDALQRTEKTILRDYSRTTEEIGLDRARADAEFVASLEAARRSSTNTLEGTAMSYAVAKQAVAAAVAAVGAGAGAGAGAAPGSGGAAPAARGPGVLSGPGDLADSLVDERFIGEDGAPIPRWLVRLQQLDKSFICEVCGGTVYQGPKIFREHFGQERHTEGLRRLGIAQNLREFEGISSIRAAIDMRDRIGGVVAGTLRKRLREDREREEIQDGQGNVLTNQEYLSLQQRGRTYAS